MTPPKPTIISINQTDLPLFIKANHSIYEYEIIHNIKEKSDNAIELQTHSVENKTYKNLLIENYLRNIDFDNCDNVNDDFHVNFDGKYLEVTCSKKENHDLYLTEPEMALFGKFLINRLTLIAKDC